MRLRVLRRVLLVMASLVIVFVLSVTTVIASDMNAEVCELVEQGSSLVSGADGEAPVANGELSEIAESCSNEAGDAEEVIVEEILDEKQYDGVIEIGECTPEVLEELALIEEGLPMNAVVTEIGAIYIFSIPFSFIQGESICRRITIIIWDTEGKYIGTMPVPANMISGLDTAIVGRQEFTISFQGFSITDSVEVEPIPVDNEPAMICWRPYQTGPTSLLLGTTLEQSNLWAGLYNADMEFLYTFRVTSEMAPGFANLPFGLHDLEVTYRGVTGYVTILLIAPQRIEPFTEQVYFLMQGEKIETAQIPIRGIGETYFIQGSFLVTSDMISGFDNTRVGQQEVTVTLLGMTTTITVEVVANPDFIPPPPNGNGENGGTPPNNGGGGNGAPPPPGGGGGVTIPEDNGSNVAPQTGDESKIPSAVIPLLMSMAAMLLAVSAKRKKITN